MSELFNQLGIDWRLLSSQAANFFILLVLLTVFVYKPVVKMLKERKAKILEGLEKADEAEARLQESNALAAKKMKETEHEALLVLRETEKKAKEMEAVLLAEAKKKEVIALKNTEAIIETRNQEARAAMRKEAVDLVKGAIARTVELSPSAIDEALIQKAIAEIRQ